MANLSRRHLLGQATLVAAGGPALAGAFSESTTPPLARMRYADYNAFYNPSAPNQTAPKIHAATAAARMAR